jgi:hypothetical protein
MEVEREQLIFDLRKALQEIKTLKGVLPTCAYCKSIRDDEGYWRRFEEYIWKHSQAEFSDGICPECRLTHFPVDRARALCGFNSTSEWSTTTQSTFRKRRS